jgi:uncharacterized protein YjbJ (UPF0337 family)
MEALPWVIAGISIGAVVAYIAMVEPGTQAETGWDSVEDAAGRTWRWGSKARASGAGSTAVGKLKEGFGRVVGDGDLMDEGVGDQVAGGLKDAAGQLAHAAGETIHDLNR